MITRLGLSQTARPVDVFTYWRDSGGMLLDPPYQRGDVWGPVRQRNLIKSILAGVPIPSIVINDRFGAGWSDIVSCCVIDGRQRITAILKFIDGQLDVPGEWFGMEGPVTFDRIDIALQRKFRHTPLQVCEGQVPSEELEREIFDLVNFGGVPQGESDNPTEQ